MDFLRFCGKFGVIYSGCLSALKQIERLNTEPRTFQFSVFAFCESKASVINSRCRIGSVSVNIRHAQYMTDKRHSCVCVCVFVSYLAT